MVAGIGAAVSGLEAAGTAAATSDSVTSDLIGAAAGLAAAAAVGAALPEVVAGSIVTAAAYGLAEAAAAMAANLAAQGVTNALSPLFNPTPDNPLGLPWPFGPNDPLGYFPQSHRPPSYPPGAPPVGSGAPGTAAHDVGNSNAETSPLVLDLTGQGISLAPLDASSPYFDLRGEGFANKTGWVGPSAGLLCLPDANGQVTSGLQLFGTAGGSANGFAALAAYDTNGDGVIDQNDAVFAQLRVWVDSNSDGHVDPGELLSLSQLVNKI